MKPAPKELKKPEKKYFKGNDSPKDEFRQQRIGYNFACDDWEKFLPSPQEIANIIRDNLIFKDLTFNEGRLELAKEISKRIGKGDDE